MSGTAGKAFVASLVAVCVVATALALWELRVLLALLLLGLVIAAAMRPGVEWLRAHRVPGGIGVALHYVVLAGLVALFLWLVVPRAIDQLSQATGGNLPTSKQELQEATRNSSGVKHEILSAINDRLKRLPSGPSVVHPALSVTTAAFEAIIGVFFTFATAAPTGSSSATGRAGSSSRSSRAATGGSCTTPGS
jgi:predicted PurR-regulated permease PerM